MQFFRHILSYFKKNKIQQDVQVPEEVFSFDAFLKSPVSDIIIPRSDIMAVSSHNTFEEVVHKFLTTGFQWLPVYRGTLDTITGVISVHCILSLRESVTQENRWSRHMNPPTFCTTSLSIEEALKLMSNPHKTPMIFVVDEHGGIEGMLTHLQIMKSLLQMWGEPLEDETMIISHDPIPVVNGRIALDFFQEEFDCHGVFDEEDEGRVNTLSGWICAYLGRVPLTGEIINHPSGLSFEIRQATPRKILQIGLLQTPIAQEASSALQEKAQ